MTYLLSEEKKKLYLKAHPKVEKHAKDPPEESGTPW